MLPTLAPLPVDRVEPPVRASTSDAAAHSPAGERFADLLEKRRSAADAARQLPADARERADAQAHAAQRPPAKGPARAPVDDSGEIRADDGKDTPFERAVGMPDAPLPAAGAEAIAQRIAGADGEASNASALAIADAMPAPASDASGDAGIDTPAQEAARSGAPRGVAARATAPVSGAERDAAKHASVDTTPRSDTASQFAPAALAAVPELQQKVAPTVGSEVSAVAPGAAPSLRPAQSLTVVAAPAASLPCAPDAQAFGHLLGVQVSLFARDGMQQAELRLNPPETGPIGVQIEIVGNDARVNFHAAQALTREAIERALPELAAALRDEGLTLTGGSVSDRPADAQGDRSAPQARSARRDANVTMDAPRSVAAPPSRQAALGRIDLYA